MKHRIWTAALIAMALANGAQAGIILGEASAAQPKTTPAALGGNPASMDKAAQKAAKQVAKAAKRAAKAEKRAAKRLAKRCRKEQRRFRKKGIPLSSVCSPASVIMVDTKAIEPAAGASSPAGNAFGLTATSNHHGMQGNGNAYGYGQGGGPSNNSLSIVTSNLPATAFLPGSGPVSFQVPSSTNGPISVPEPTTLSLLALGLLGLGAAGRRRGRMA